MRVSYNKEDVGERPYEVTLAICYPDHTWTESLPIFVQNGAMAHEVADLATNFLRGSLDKLKKECAAIGILSIESPEEGTYSRL